MRHPIPETTWPSQEEAARSLLFSPIRIGRIVSESRTWVPAMVPWRATESGFVTDEVLDWYARFAEGQPGVIVIEATGIRDIKSGPLLRIGDDRFLDGLRELVATVARHSRGRTKLLVQLIDFLTIRRRPEREVYLRRFLVLRDAHRDGLERLGRGADARGSEAEVREALIALPTEDLHQLLSSREREDLEFGYRERVGDTHLPHIAELPSVLPDLFASAVQRAREAGFDGVELHFAHAYTMASFLSRLNNRTDGYGGSREARVRLPLEVYSAVRERVGEDYTVGCRFLTDDSIEGGSTVEDAIYYAERFAAAGLDFLSLSKGGKFEDARQPKIGEAAYPYTGPSGHECMPTVRIEGAPPFGRNLPPASEIRSRIRSLGYTTPVIASGGINSFELAERALREGACDVVAAARQSLADPDWFEKIRLGRGAEIRRCLYTNYCEGLDQQHKQVTCQLWDRDFADSDPWPERGAQIRRSSDGKRRLIAPPWKQADPRS